MAAGLAAFALAAIWLGPEEFGAFTFVYSTSATFGTSIGTSVVYYLLKRLRFAQGSDKVRYLRSQSLLISAVLSSLAGGLVVLTSAVVSSDIVLPLAALPPTIATSIIATVAQLAVAELQPIKMFMTNLARAIILVVGLLVTGIFVGAENVLIAYAASSVTAATAVVIMFNTAELHHIGRARWRWWGRAIWKSIYLAPYIASAFVPTYLQSLVAIDLTRSAAGLQLSGYYNVGRQWQGVIQLVGGACTSFFMPRMAGNDYQQHKSAFRWNRVLSTLYALTLPACAIAIVPIIIEVYFDNDTAGGAAGVLYALVFWSSLVQYVNPKANRNVAAGRLWPAMLQNVSLAVVYVSIYFCVPVGLLERVVCAVIGGAIAQFVLQIVIDLVNYRSIRGAALDIVVGAAIGGMMGYIGGEIAGD